MGFDGKVRMEMLLRCLKVEVVLILVGLKLTVAMAASIGD